MDNDDQIEKLPVLPSEKFQEVDGGAAITDDGHLVRYCFRTLNKYPIVYGSNRYTTGTHEIRFRIDKRGELRSFVGIIASSERVSRVISIETDNKSLYGWWGLNIFVKNGKTQRIPEKTDLEKSEDITFIIKCDQHQIQLEHRRTKRLLQLSIDPSTCPFPWRVVVELTSYGDWARILQ